MVIYQTRLSLVQLGKIFPNAVRWRRTRRQRFLLIYFPIIWITAGSPLKSRSYPACKSWAVKPLLYQIRNMRYICRKEPIGKRLMDYLAWWQRRHILRTQAVHGRQIPRFCWIFTQETLPRIPFMIPKKVDASSAAMS